MFLTTSSVVPKWCAIVVLPQWQALDTDCHYVCRSLHGTQEQRRGLVGAEEGEYEPFNPDLADRREDPFSAAESSTQHGQKSGSALGRQQFGGDAYRPPSTSADAEVPLPTEEKGVPTGLR